MLSTLELYSRIKYKSHTAFPKTFKGVYKIIYTWVINLFIIRPKWKEGDIVEIMKRPRIHEGSQEAIICGVDTIYEIGKVTYIVKFHNPKSIYSYRYGYVKLHCVEEEYIRPCKRLIREKKLKDILNI